MSKTPSQSFLQDPNLLIYALCAGLLTLKMFFSTFRVTSVRVKYTSFKYEEDYGKPYDKLSEKTKERIEKGKDKVKRALALHQNDIENIYVFYTIGFLYALAQPVFVAPIYFSYVVFRYLHTVCYVKKLQPWRMITHVLSMVILVGMTLRLVYVTGSLYAASL